MYPLFIITLFFAIISVNNTLIIPANVALQAETAASVSAASFAVYRNALMTWKAANPGISGTVSTSLLSLPQGVTTITGWNNVIVSGTLFIYSTATPTPADRSAIIKANPDPTSLGVVTSQGVGTLITQTTIAIPATIPVGATFAWSI